MSSGMAHLEGEELPMQAEAHDTMRRGLSALKDEAAVSHPVELIQGNYAQQRDQVRVSMMANLYGSAVPARLNIEKQILSRIRRLPGLPSSNICLESMTGDLDDFSVESYLGSPAEREVPGVDMHSQMEAQLGMNLKPVTRGML